MKTNYWILEQILFCFGNNKWKIIIKKCVFHNQNHITCIYHSTCWNFTASHPITFTNHQTKSTTKTKSSLLYQNSKIRDSLIQYFHASHFTIKSVSFDSNIKLICNGFLWWQKSSPFRIMCWSLQLIMYHVFPGWCTFIILTRKIYEVVNIFWEKI